MILFEITIFIISIDSYIYKKIFNSKISILIFNLNDILFKQFF